MNPFTTSSGDTQPALEPPIEAYRRARREADERGARIRERSGHGRAHGNEQAACIPRSPARIPAPDPDHRTGVRDVPQPPHIAASAESAAAGPSGSHPAQADADGAGLPCRRKRAPART